MKNNFEKLSLIEDRKNGLSYGKISKKYKIPRSTIQYIVRESKTSSKKRGPKEKLDKNDKRKIKTLLDNNIGTGEKCSSSDIMKELKLEVSKSTVCRTLKCLQYNYKNLPNKFRLTYHMRQKRVQVAREFIISQIKWNTVIFSDEKLFTLHGSNSYYTWIKNNQSPERVRKVIRCSGLMVWAMIMPNGLLSYNIMKGKQNSATYVDILKSRALPIMKLNMDGKIIFQQDNCPIHISQFSRNFFQKSNLELLNWPPYSPDLNIIENIWAMISDDVYKSGIIKNLKELESKIKISIQRFNETRGKDVETLYKSIPSRLCSIIEGHGQRLKY